jgi:hypothetical protein
VRHVLGIPFEDALERINGERIKAARTTPGAENETFVSPVPADAPPAPAEHPNLGKPTGWWTYLTDKGGLESHVVRFDLPNGSKEFRPLTLWRGPEGLRWRWRGVPAPRRLYGHDRLAARPEASVLICEGEKAADTAQRIFPEFVALTSANGAKAVATADWTSLRGRDAIIWRDNDNEGVDYEREVGRILLGLDCKVSNIDVAELVEIGGDRRGSDFDPDGWDAADAEREWSDIGALRVKALELVAAVATPNDLAEGTPDPLEGLVERSAADPGAVFEPEMLQLLAALKQEDRAAFEALRVQLKQAGCRVTKLDQALAHLDRESGGGAQTKADILIGLAAEAELFHAPDGTGFADLNVRSHRETWAIRSKGFKRWLARCFFEATEGAPSSEALQSALNVIEAKAHFDGPERIVRVRVGGLNGKIYLDLADEKWRAVEIDSTGWRVVENSSVRFSRPAGIKPLPVPAPGGSIEKLRSFLNVRSDADFILVIAWSLAVLRDRGPYPVLVLSGEQGSAKSTAAAILRALLDPNTAPLRALPRDDRDLFVTANNGHVLTFDNVSGLPNWVSDTLCRLATGGGFAVRQLYTDQDEVLFDAARPVILNGIEDIVSRPDLADRAVFLPLEPIPDEHRRPEAELWAEFLKEQPGILGALLDAVAEGLKNLAATRIPKLPRLADFALWVSACERALWPPSTFLSAYESNRDEAIDSVIEGDPVASALRTMMALRQQWSGTASDLLGSLSIEVGERIARSKSWPQTPKGLSGRLRGAATFLRKRGIEIAFDRDSDRDRTRKIHICASGRTEDEKNASNSYRPSAPGKRLETDPKPTNNITGNPTPQRTQCNGSDDASAQPVDASALPSHPSAGAHAEPLKANDSAGGADALDALDASFAPPNHQGKQTWRGRL